MYTFPWLIGSLISTKVSIRRLSKFLLSEELDKKQKNNNENKKRNEIDNNNNNNNNNNNADEKIYEFKESQTQ